MQESCQPLSSNKALSFRCIDCRNDFLHDVYPKAKIEEFKEKRPDEYADTVATRILELSGKLIVEAAVRG